MDMFATRRLSVDGRSIWNEKPHLCMRLSTRTALLVCWAATLTACLETERRQPPADAGAPEDGGCSSDCNGKIASFDCASIPDSGFNWGTLRCTTECTVDRSECRTYPPEYALCQGDGQGTCMPGMSCRPVNVFGTQASMCWTECDASQPNTCGENRTCDRIDVFSQTTGLCYDRDAQRDQACGGMTGKLCADPAPVECALTVYHAEECKLSCPGQSVNTADAVCPSGESCLASPYVELEGPENAPRRCPNGDADCTVSAQYRCLMVSPGFGAPEPTCARPRGWCGVKAPLLTQFTDQSAAGWTYASLCNLPGTSRYCAPLEQGTARVECADLTYTDWQRRDGGAVACSKEKEAFECDMSRGFECMQFNSGNYCALRITGCAALCEAADGGLLDCGPGLSCTTPELAVAGTALQLGNAGGRVSCSGANDHASCASGHRCVEFPSGWACARFKKVCQAP